MLAAQKLLLCLYYGVMQGLINTISVYSAYAAVLSENDVGLLKTLCLCESGGFGTAAIVREASWQVACVQTYIGDLEALRLMIGLTMSGIPRRQTFFQNRTIQIY